MTPIRVLKTTLAAAAAVFALSWGGGLTAPGRGLMSSAEARIGRPATPLSYAGVARRTTRRAVAVGAAGAAAAGAAATYAYPAPGCVQVVDSYGRVITQCR
jgi:hypothetical protein